MFYLWRTRAATRQILLRVATATVYLVDTPGTIGILNAGCVGVILFVQMITYSWRSMKNELVGTLAIIHVFGAGDQPVHA